MSGMKNSSKGSANGTREAAMYYKAVGVDDLQTATKSEITKAYKKLAMSYHPDRCPDKEKATAVMAIVGAARDREFQRREEIAEFSVDGQASSHQGVPSETTRETDEQKARRRAGQAALRRKKQEARKNRAKKGKGKQGKQHAKTGRLGIGLYK